DKPLDELKRYQGINPRPADFAEYWETALAEMRAVDPQVELLKSSFQTPFAERYASHFPGVRGARIHAKYYKPIRSSQAPGPAVVQFHGYSGNAGNWTDHLGYAAAGFTVLAMDARGQGGKSEDTGGV